MSPVPADDSSSNRESVLRSNAMFSMPLVGVLKREKEHEFCSFPLPAGSEKGPHFMLLELPAGLVSNEIHIQLRGGLNDVLHICVILVLRQPWTTHSTGTLTTLREYLRRFPSNTTQSRIPLCFTMILPTDMDLVPGAACTSVLLLFLSSLSMSDAVVDIGVADFEPVKSDNSSCEETFQI